GKAVLGATCPALSALIPTRELDPGFRRDAGCGSDRVLESKRTWGPAGAASRQRAPVTPCNFCEPASVLAYGRPETRPDDGGGHEGVGRSRRSGQGRGCRGLG